ncbi:MAG: hypothetical protein HQM09_15575 [Candidatus Riflebacteria bacterium]|nr:hypothetical protein [Candidatus Riflebacteria bacterium]
MNRVVFTMALISLALAFSGCASNGLSSLPQTTSVNSELATTDLAAVEGALMANRIEVAQGYPGISGSVQDDESASDSYVMHRGGRFQRQGGHDFPPPGMNDPFTASGTARPPMFRRGGDGCPFGIASPTASSPRLIIASAALTVEKFGDTGYRIIRPDGSDVKIVRPTDNSATSTIEVNGVTWNVAFGTTAADPLATLTSTKNNRVIRIFEDDSGNLSLITEGGCRFHGKWDQAGILELNDETGQHQYRFCSSK